MGRVGLHESLRNSGLLFFFFVFIITTYSCSAARSSKVRLGDPEIAFQRIRTESQRGNFLQARSEAQQYYTAWQAKPDTKWHWKFKLLDAEMLLLNGETRQANALLSTLPPPQFADLVPRLHMLQGYVAFREGRETDARALISAAAAPAPAAAGGALLAAMLLSTLVSWSGGESVA